MTFRIARSNGFARFTLAALVWNVVVILWGVFLRASKSGDGCGQHWLTCHGEVIPSAPELKTVIEFSHRVTSFIALLLVVMMAVWAFRKFAKGSPIRKTAVGSVVFILTEALVGAGLVLTGNTAETLTAARPFWMAGHLLNTFILLAFLTLTFRYATGAGPMSFRVETKYLAAIVSGIVGIVIVGTSGSIAALSNMIFPSETLAEGLAKDLSPASNVLVKLRLLHPVSSILIGVGLVFLSGWLRRASDDDTAVKKWSDRLSVLVLIQLAFGAATLLMLGPIVMQLGHLLLADLIWISFVMLSASFLAKQHQMG